MKEATLLELRDVSVQYGGVKALAGVDVTIDEGEVVALMGPNGAGKSTVLKAIFGLAPIESGRVIWEGSEIKLAPHEIVELGISFVPQGRRVFRHLSVYENIEIGGHNIKNRAVLKERIEEAFEIFPALKEKVSQKSGQLSGGQQQMVALARGLVTDPKLLLLDEPSLGLAPKVVKEVFAKIKEINEKRGTAILVVEHNIKSILEIATRAYVLDKGKVVTKGTGKSFTQSDILEKVFMGVV
ncbi:ABC transporter ATP-binding protein [Candidatus Kaiserbacteria bacterium]|nr:ABC transporter ATP-binding protein [Candidatus Kaiserbacteria bacterium]